MVRDDEVGIGMSTQIESPPVFVLAVHVLGMDDPSWIKEEPSLKTWTTDQEWKKKSLCTARKAVGTVLLSQA